MGLIYEINVLLDPRPGAACAFTDSRGGSVLTELMFDKLFFLLSAGRVSSI